MAFSITEDCKLTRVDEELLAHCNDFTCGASDLDDFLYNDSMAYENDLMGKTYCWLLKEDNTNVVGYVTLANAGIQTTHLQNNPKRHLNKI